MLAVVLAIACFNVIAEAQALGNKKSDACSDNPRIMRVSPKVLKDRVTHSVDIKIPKDGHYEGKVLIHLLVNTDGSVKCAKYKDGHPLLKKAALKAVSQWIFKPITLSNVPVQYYGDLEINVSEQTGKKDGV
jgi:DNA-directed RNA polymerase subunit L